MILSNTLSYRHLIYALAIVPALSSCNSDIFIADSDLPDSVDVTVEGDGGSWSTAYSRKGLLCVRLDLPPDDGKYVTYYGYNGELDPDSPPSELQSIVYESPLRSYSIGFNGDMIYVVSHYNASYEDRVTLWLDYDYGVSKMIELTMTEGEPLQKGFWDTKGPLKIEENIETTSHRAGFTNNSSLTQKFQIMPYLESKCSDIVMPADRWALGLTFDLPMPTYNGSDWVWYEYPDIRLGERRHFSPSQYIGKTLSVDVPPETKVTVSYTLHYSRAVQDGSIYFYNVVAQREFEVPVTWTSVYATSYDYMIEYE